MSPANYIRGLASNIVDALGNFLTNHGVGDINVLVAEVNKMGSSNNAYIQFIETVHEYMPDGWQWEVPGKRISDLCESREGLATIRRAIKKYVSQN